VPLYEYACDACGHRFERLVRTGETPDACPSCEAPAPRKLFSAFAVAADSTKASSSATPCGTCGDPRGPGACSWDN